MTINKGNKMMKKGKGKKNMTTNVKTWGVQNRDTGKIAYTRVSNYHSKALYETREQARAALREGRVFADPARGTIVRFWD